MDIIGLKFGLLLVWAFGIACVAAMPRRMARSDEPGETAWIIGTGGLVGLFLATLWLRALSLVGVHFSAMAIALPMLMATVALGAVIVQRRRKASNIAPGTAARACISKLASAVSGSTLEGAARAWWRVLLAWLALRAALLFVEVATNPLYPWDAWTQWATKARVWYELGRIVPFARADVWFGAGGAAYFDAGPHYPGTVGLMQVVAGNFLGRWDDTLINIPFWMLAIAFGFAVYGALRTMEFTPPWALTGTWFVSSLPLANAHVALAGYADLPLAIYFCVAILALVRWLRTREPADAALALLLLAACPLLKIPGRIWALLALPALIVGLLPRQGMRVVATGYAVAILGFLVLAQTSPVVMGYQLHLDFAPDWGALGNSFFLYDNWHLLWYGAIAVALLGWRQAVTLQVAPLTVVVAGGVLFISFVLLFTNARAWLSDQSTVNRATLHFAPLVVVWMLVVFRAWSQTLRGPEAPAAPVADAGEMPQERAAPAAAPTP